MILIYGSGPHGRLIGLIKITLMEYQYSAKHRLMGNGACMGA